MIFFRKRLFFWLIKAYIKRWGGGFFIFFILGLGVFFSVRFLFLNYFPKIPFFQQDSIGVVGAYTFDTLPNSITDLVSMGLTTITKDGVVKPAVATSWKIENEGKKYTFILNKNVTFTDGTKLKSNLITYSFKDAVIERPDHNTIVFNLKDNFSPFLVSISNSRPIFKEGYIGVGKYKIKNIKLNGNFIESLTLVSRENKYKIKIYNFYPSQDALKLAFALGEITHAEGLSDTKFQDTSFSTFPNVKTQKTTNYRQLVTIFYNTKDKVLSDSKVRGALSYALPDTFVSGERNYGPFPTFSWAHSDIVFDRKHDISHAQLLLKAAFPDKKTDVSLILKTLPKYKDTAEKVKKAWEELGIKTKIEVVDTLPTTFQAFLGDFTVPRDPDQYILWHSDQEKNITRYSNLRIDKLLEDGRKITDRNERKKIYDDFQKYLLADSPASFLYFPYEYTIKKK